MEPTPRPDRISKDYAQEYPSIEVDARRSVKNDTEKKKNIENVKFDGEVSTVNLEKIALV